MHEVPATRSVSAAVAGGLWSEMSQSSREEGTREAWLVGGSRRQLLWSGHGGHLGGHLGGFGLDMLVLARLWRQLLLVTVRRFLGVLVSWCGGGVLVTVPFDPVAFARGCAWEGAGVNALPPTGHPTPHRDTRQDTPPRRTPCQHRAPGYTTTRAWSRLPRTRPHPKTQDACGRQVLPSAPRWPL